MPAHTLPGVRLHLLVVTVLLVGCGQAEGPQASWESRTGPTWEAYKQAFRTGWTEGCEAASDRVEEEQPWLPTTGLCGHPPTGPGDEVVPPDAPPDDPEGEGHADGLIAGCESAYLGAGREQELDICATGELFG
jgi:hypothetical protein